MEKKNWIQKAVNKKHKGYCTPMTKSTCTPKRKALAQTFKSMAKSKKHEKGGSIEFLISSIEGYKKGGKVENTFGKDQPFPKLMKKEEKGGKLSKEYIKKAHEKSGGSNVGKEKFANGKKRTGPYVGSSGGSPKGSYPIPDVKHAKAAIKLSGHAPNPEGIKKAVYKKFPQLKKHQTGGSVTATADSTKYFQKQMADNMANHFKAQGKDAKDEAAKKATQSKEALKRQANKGKPGYDKNGFPIVNSKQKGGELESVGDQAAAYKKGNKVNKQMGGQIYGAAKKGTKIDASKWKKSK